MAQKTAAENIRDELIAHDIDLRRVSAGMARQVNARLNTMNADLRGMLARIDPGGTTRRDARERRLARIEREVQAIVDEAYREIRIIVNSDMKRVAKAETVAVANAINGALP